jgi:hypothetical protein
MASLITTTDKVREFATVNANMSFENLKPHIDAVEADIIIPALSPAMHSVIAVTGALSTKLDQLRTLAQRALANLALYEGAKGDFQVELGDGGMRQSHGQDMKPVFERNVRDYQQDKFLKGYQALDAMLVFLEENESDSVFSPWKTSSAYTIYAKNFIRSGADFRKYYTLVQSRYLFLQMLPDMESAEEGIVKETLHQTLYNTVKTTWGNGTITADNLKLIPYIQKLVADTTIAKGLDKLSIKVDQRGITVYLSGSTDTTEQAIPAPQDKINRLMALATREAELSAKRLSAFLQLNKADYPDYTSDPAYNENSPQVLGGVTSENGKVVVGI